METFVFGAIRPRPESCEPEKEPEPESESNSKSKVVLRPNWDWQLKPLEDLTVSDDFSSFEDDIAPFLFSCPRFVYKNKAHREKEAASKRDLFEDDIPFNAIPVPFLAMTCSSNFPRPIDIDDDDDDKRPLLTHLSKFSLDKYNAENKGSNYEFEKLVKAARRPVPRGTYYITFEAKDATDTDASNRPATTFQAHVWNKSSARKKFEKELPVVKSCSIKT
ncbi:putative Cystatin domain-containing protein [Medicago truncatula]|uniref:Putative Cystatin domain-containing protein n=1 Tax=Medicago truncatula TaxID=3880 RepID=A0A396IWP9_MEDTR|nr:putative Cystatin domain-containing protein [Medicago truncatula]